MEMFSVGHSRMKDGSKGNLFSSIKEAIAHVVSQKNGNFVIIHSNDDFVEDVFRVAILKVKNGKLTARPCEHDIFYREKETCSEFVENAQIYAKPNQDGWMKDDEESWSGSFREKVYQKYPDTRWLYPHFKGRGKRFRGKPSTMKEK